MTTYLTSNDRNRDAQDGVERHVWGEIEYKEGKGSTLTVRGTGTTDYEVQNINLGYGFNLSKNYNTEVITIADGSDMSQKMALATIPRDKQRQWAVGTGGVQNPLDPSKALEFNSTRAHLRENNVAFGNNGALEMKDGTLYIRCNVVFEGDLNIKGNVNVTGNLQCKGEARFNGPVSTPQIKSPSSSSNNSQASFDFIVPPFENT